LIPDNDHRLADQSDSEYLKASQFDRLLKKTCGIFMSLINKIYILLLVFILVACEESAPVHAESSAVESGQLPESGGVVQEPATAESSPTPTAAEQIEQSLREVESEMGINIFDEPWTGDLDVMIENRIIRVLTVYGLGRYFLDGPTEKGLTFEIFKMFEEFVNKRMESGHLRIHVVFIPVARDQLIPGLMTGRGDIAAAGLTITAERDELIDFTKPVSRELSEVLVTGPAAPQLDSIDDLAGQTIYVRASSSYRSSLDTLNQRFEEQGLEEMDIQDVAELLEDEDILEMVNAGLLPWAVVDDYKANIWADIFQNLKVRSDLALRSGGRIGFAMREESPQLQALLNEFLKTHKQGTLKGNILINRYLRDFDWAKNALAADDYKRFQDVVNIFTKFGDQYGVDYLMVAAQGYQESGLNQSARSRAGAIGIMQLLPSTAADPNVGIPDISTAESNIHAGVKYLDFIRERYFSDPEIDRFNQTMFAFAAYNAGPARIRKLRSKAAAQGYDPNLWFDNVEVIAAREIGRETVQYVANILKYYVAYSLTIKTQLEREKARERAGID
jgi:membrane-bound lytic murein transglycosylase MltF